MPRPALAMVKRWGYFLSFQVERLVIAYHHKEQIEDALPIPKTSHMLGSQRFNKVLCAKSSYYMQVTFPGRILRVDSTTVYLQSIVNFRTDHKNRDLLKTGLHYSTTLKPKTYSLYIFDKPLFGTSDLSKYNPSSTSSLESKLLGVLIHILQTETTPWTI